MHDGRKNIIVEKTFDFALFNIDYSELLESNKKYVLARQILKSGTSIGANVREAQNGESKVDFIHKMKVAAEEADETEYWLLLCQRSKNYPDSVELIDKVKEIIRILSKIISSSKNLGAAVNFQID